MRIIQGIVMAIGVIAILAFVTIAIGYFLYTLTPGIQARMIPVAVTAEAAESFDQKLDDLETEIKKTAEDGDKQDITVTITENEINSKLLELLAEGKIPLHLSKPLINLRDGRFLVYGVIDVPGVSAKTGAIGRIELTEGSPKIVIEDFDLGKLPLSNRFNKRVEDLTNVLVKLQLADWPLDMTKISITDRQLTFSAKWKSAQ
jgi:uncharacterized protein YxeA